MTSERALSATSRASAHLPLSALLERIAADDTGDRVTIGDLLSKAGDRAFGALMFIFALPNIVPTPPGTSMVLGLPLVILCAQFLWGRKTPWLPKFIGSRWIAKASFVAVVNRAAPALRRFEKVLKPRMSFMVSPLAERLLGVWLLLLAVILFLPIPFGNMLPAAAICIMALALVEHDGLAVLLGVLTGVCAIVLVWGALFAMIHVGLAILRKFG